MNGIQPGVFFTQMVSASEISDVGLVHSHNNPDISDLNVTEHSGLFYLFVKDTDHLNQKPSPLSSGLASSITPFVTNLMPLLHNTPKLVIL